MRLTLRIAAGTLVALALGATFFAGYFTASTASASRRDVFAGAPPDPAVAATVRENLKVFWEAWDLLQENYYQGPLEPQDLIHGAIRGLVRSPGDPYTDWIDAEQAKADKERIQGHFEGIGATVELSEDGFLRIVEVLPGSPAEKSGLRVRDLVLAVDGLETKGKTLEDLVTVVRGPKGTAVVLTVRSEGEERARDLTIVRDEVIVPSVEAHAAQEFGYVRVMSFGARTPDELEDALRGFRDQGVKGLILDLRNNPGGLLDTAVKVAGQFLPKGSVVAIEKSRTEGEHRFAAPGGGQALDLPLVVLINNGSASASEIVAGAIRDLERGKLLGEKTFGKGSVQVPFELSDESVVRVTVATWETPGGTHLVGEGIEPDIQFSAGAPNPGAADDPYLDAAIRVLRGEPCCAELAKAA